MTSEHDELLARLDGWVASRIRGSLANQATAAIRALTAQVVERDAVIEQMPHHEDCDWWEIEEETHGDCTCPKSQAPRDALAARDAVRDKTVRATALRDAAEDVERQAPGEPYAGATFADHAQYLRARADQEEGKNDR